MNSTPEEIQKKIQKYKEKYARSMRRKDAKRSILLDLALILTMTINVLFIPYTKVEESFNLQAMHDFVFLPPVFDFNKIKFILTQTYGSLVTASNSHQSFSVFVNIMNSTFQALHHAIIPEGYDHVKFPGVVPRTFVGPFLLSLPLRVVHPLLETVFGPATATKIYMQYAARILLGVLVCLSLGSFRRGVSKRLSKLYFSNTLISGNIVPAFEITFTIVVAFQPHLIFYGSRPLPNTFALIGVLLGASALLRKRYNVAVSILAFTAFVVRSDVIPLVGLLFLFDWDFDHKRWNWGFFRTISMGLVAAVFSILITSIFDSIVWGRLLWPEGEVLYFNTILNKSSEWGVSPFHWYFTSVVPKVMLSTLPFIAAFVVLPLSAERYALHKQMLPILAAPLGFIFLYSFLPHKELRFIIHAFPLLDVIAVLGMLATIKFLTRRIPLKFSFSLVWAFFSAPLGLFSIVFFDISLKNYPGGVAFAKWHKDLALATKQPGSSPIRVYIDNYAAQTGVSRFGEVDTHFLFTLGKDYATKTPIIYDKDPSRHGDFSQFDYVITENTTVDGGDFNCEVGAFAYAGIDFKNIRVRESPRVWICRKGAGYVYDKDDKKEIWSD